MNRLKFLAPLLALPLALTACDFRDGTAQPSCYEIDIDHPKTAKKPRATSPKAPAYKALRPAPRRR